MRVRIAGLVAGLATALIAPFAGSVPAMAAQADGNCSGHLRSVV
jgi:hypothetical protein